VKHKDKESGKAGFAASHVDRLISFQLSYLCYSKTVKKKIQYRNYDIETSMILISLSSRCHFSEEKRVYSLFALVNPL